ncbi:MAG TPA: sigma-70 family RNA polymerase sigma factor [Gemmatimonadaceae bacterium]|nr:sigma-70 family RNA polymerase sigma factor [Gemmatimonadaceae bacterium]
MSAAALRASADAAAASLVLETSVERPAFASAAPSAPRAERAHAPSAAERAIVVAAQQGDADAFGALVRAHQRRAYAVARAIVLTHEDAEDAVQEGFLHAYRALDRFRPDQPFGAWLSRIVANAALDLARRKKVRDADQLSDVVPSPFRDPAEDGDLRGRLRAALALLGDRQRAVIVLHDVEGFKHAEIARTLGIPEGTARSDLHHARAQLRRTLGDLWSDR